MSPVRSSFAKYCEGTGKDISQGQMLKLDFNSYIDGAVRPNAIYHMQYIHCAILMLNGISCNNYERSFIPTKAKTNQFRDRLLFKCQERGFG